MRGLRWLALLLLLAVRGYGATADFEAANQEFEEGHFGEAKARYEKLVEARAWTASLFYNLGNTEYRLGSPGRAILNYERALALEPAHPEALANLRFLRGKTGAKIPARAWWEPAFPWRSANVWSVMMAVGAWGLIFSMTLLAVRRRQGWWLAVFGSAGLCAYAGGALWLADQARATGIVTGTQAEARLAPADSAGLAETLPAGSRVRILSERGEWIYCTLPGKGRGWIPHRALERLHLAG